MQRAINEDFGYLDEGRGIRSVEAEKIEGKVILTHMAAYSCTVGEAESKPTWGTIAHHSHT